MGEETFRGRCFCGEIRFEVRGPVLYCCFCHCESCRRASGGAFVPWVTFGKQSLSVPGPQIRLYHSSPGVTRGHCPNCGTSLTYEHADRKGQVDIAMVAFDDPGLFEPVAHIWVEDKLASVEIGDRLPRYERTAG